MIRGSAAGRDTARRVEHAAFVPARVEAPLHVNFPDCWNGKTIDSVDHKRHMGRTRSTVAAHGATRSRCPAFARLPVPAATGKSIALSSGSVYSAHADFLNAWDEDALKALVAHRLNALRPWAGHGSSADYFGRRAAIAFASFVSSAGEGALRTDVMISTVSAWPAPWRIRSR